MGTWESNLQSMVGARFEGSTIRTDGGVRVCKDCAQRCFAQMQDCVGFVFEQDSNSDRGKCTYFSRIDAVSTVTSDSVLALATSLQFQKLSLPSLIQLHDAKAN